MAETDCVDGHDMYVAEDDGDYVLSRCKNCTYYDYTRK